MPEKKKKTKKDIKARKRDLKPQKNPKAGMMRFSRSSTKQPTGLAFQ
jgi:hypothetical protein